MFTGLITDVGTLDLVSTTDAGREFRVLTSFEELVAGESIALNGTCLTVRECGEGWFTVAAVGPTLGRTTLGEWGPSYRMNLERALAVGDRLGGHIVQGHVDDVATVRRAAPQGDALLIDLAMPPSLMPLVVLHGSIAIDGVSLTVNALPDAGTVQLSLIEFTLRHTTLGDLKPGQRVNVEVDVLAKHVQRLVHAYTPEANAHSSI